jgi:heterodisulfide reductase subunit B
MTEDGRGQIMAETEDSKIKIPYFPGCTLKTTAKNFESSAVKSAEKLGVEMVELPKWNCCGTVSSLASDDLMKHLAPVRDFIRVEEMNEAGVVDNEYRMLTLCSMCFNTLKQTNARVKASPEDLESVNNFMYLEKDYQGKVEVTHLFELLDERGFDALQDKVTHSLKGLKVAPYYGCLLLRPKSVGIDNAENPSIIERFITAIGGNPVENWEARSRCCGSYHTVENKAIVVKLAKGIIENARSAGAECIITSCPLCAFNLDSRQEEIIREDSEYRPMPVFYFTQLLGLALGLDKKDLRFEDNFIDPEPLLVQKGLNI